MNKVNLSQISEHWSPRMAGELNGQQVKRAKLKGEFVWHRHEKEDEFFYVIKGELTIDLRDKNSVLKLGEFFNVPEA
jgi:mannose-6-phosphate isomerase-like protein (cupin superfamily)